MKKKNSEKKLSWVSLWIAVVLVSFSQRAVADVICGSNGCSFPDDVWCASESETYVPGAPQGAPVEHSNILLDATECNLGAAGSSCVNPAGPDSIGSYPWSITWTESILNSCTGSDQMGIGLTVGEAAVGQLSLSHAIQTANTCQFTDIYTFTQGQTWNYDVTPSTCQHKITKGIWLDGHWKGSSYFTATANNGLLGNGFNSYTVTCSPSTADAIGSNHYVRFDGTLETKCSNPIGG